MKRLIALCITAACFFTGCSSNKVTGSWKLPGIPTQDFKKILVLALIPEPDRTLSGKMELDMVAQLRAMGYNAICSCDEFGPKYFEKLDEREALNKLDSSGIDAVLTIVLLNKSMEKYYVPERVYYSPYNIYHNRFWGYYNTMHARVFVPGYYETNTNFFWETNLYRTTGETQLLYASHSISFNPASAVQLTMEYGQTIVRHMEKEKILASRNRNKAF